MTFANPELRNLPPGAGQWSIEDMVRLCGEFAAVRILNFLPSEHARSLADHLTADIVYERDEIGDTKRANRASRSGEMPNSPLVTTSPASPPALAGLNFLTSPGWLERLSGWFGQPIQVLRPPTPYRLDARDYVDPHDDCPAPEYTLSVSLNLTDGWRPSDGGETVVGLVDHVEEYDHPEWFMPLNRWHIGDERHVVTPTFNSALLLPLSPRRAHAVRTVTHGPRYSITTLYGSVAGR
ncbi:2OG-Fe(II) oxygenase [Nocardia kruczakiae]|uniref:2OG-Fe(II) oxygenase n=1 Tax=Nocardia kruczakiae TaxID=261477 RepID=UPI0009FCA33D|nr:2OG-Fe(II) oxygenase [Nocardia kruczakiae]